MVVDRRMRKVCLSLLALTALTLGAHAQDYTVTHIGNFDYYSGPNGYSGTGQRIGQFYYYNDNYGSGTGQTIGNQSYYHYNRFGGFDCE
jgi:hypothetical protein